VPETNEDGGQETRGAYILGMVNVGVWAIAIIAMVFLMQRCPGAKGMFPILAGGVAVGIALLSTIGRR
jgi:hypothetical protein